MTNEPGQALRRREAAIHREEQEMRRSEERSMAECAQLKSAAGALIARLQTARAAAAHLSAAGPQSETLETLAARIRAAVIPDLNSDESYSKVLTLREEALEARSHVLEDLRHQLHLFGGALSRLTSELTADEQMLQDMEGHLLREGKAQAVARPEGRRALIRVRLQVPVIVERQGEERPGASGDVSQAGAFVALADPPAPHSLVTLRFALPEGPRLELRGEVRWMRTQSDKLPEIFPGAGVRFTELPSNVAQALESYVQSRADRFFPA